MKGKAHRGGEHQWPVKLPFLTCSRDRRHERVPPALLFIGRATSILHAPVHCCHIEIAMHSG